MLVENNLFKNQEEFNLFLEWCKSEIPLIIKVEEKEKSNIEKHEQS